MYILTGVLPAFRAGITSPLSAVGLVSADPNLHGICGFTEHDVKAIAQNTYGRAETGWYFAKYAEILRRILFYKFTA